MQKLVRRERRLSGGLRARGAEGQLSITQAKQRIDAATQLPTQREADHVPAHDALVDQDFTGAATRRLEQPSSQPGQGARLEDPPP